MKYCVYNTKYPEYPETFQDQEAGTQKAAVYDTEAKANEVCALLNKSCEQEGLSARYAVRCHGEPMCDRIREMTNDELKNFIYWVYQQGNRDGRDGVGDSEMGFFGGAILAYSADTIEYLWNPEVRKI